MPVIPDTQEAETGRITVHCQPWKKVSTVSKTSISTNKLCVALHACYPGYTGGISKSITVQASPGKKCEILPEK
jgi:hypothetical protein